MGNFEQEIKNLKEENKLIWNKEKTFNIFTVLVKNYDEVRLHSRFITSLLDPNGVHRMGTRPLELFMECINCGFQCSENTKVTPNSSDWTEDGDIDILIEDSIQNFAIIIENKIYSGDNNSDSECGQLQKYFWQIQNAKYRQNGKVTKERANKHRYPSDKIKVYYLTLDGHNPNEYSTSHNNARFKDLKKEVKNISYGKEIKKWLEKLNEVKKDEYCSKYVNVAIEQYNEVINEIVGNVELNIKLTDLVNNHFNEVKYLESDKLEEILGERFVDVKWHTITNLLNELENSLNSAGFELQEREQPMHLSVTDMIHHPKKHSPLYFRIKRDDAIWTLQADDKCPEKGFFLGVDKSTQKDLHFDHNENEDDGWYFRIYMDNNQRINLWNFHNEKTFNIFNQAELKEVVNNIVKFVDNQIGNSKT